MNFDLKTYEKDFDKFFDNLGFNFQMIFDWIDLKGKTSLDIFIKAKIAKKKDIIVETFENNVQLKEKILGAEKIENLKFRMEEYEFLQKNNIIIRSSDRKFAWHDRVVEKAFEELKKQK